MKYLDGVKEDRASGATKEQAIRAEAKASEVLSAHEAERFREMVDELDPSFDELDNAAKDFNKKAKELGVTDVVNDNSLTQDEKDAKIGKIFEDNPDFQQSRDHLVKSQEKYRKLTSGINHVLHKHNDQVPKGSHVNTHDLHNKMNKKPTEPEKGVDSMVDKIALLVYAAIKKAIDKLFRRNRHQEITGPDQDPNEVRYSVDHSAEVREQHRAAPRPHVGGMSGPK